MVKNSIVQYVAIILFSLTITITGLELYHANSANFTVNPFAVPNIDYIINFYKDDVSDDNTGAYEKTPHLRHEELGYVLKPQWTANEKRFFEHNGKKDVIYDITFTTNALGQRTTPKHDSAKTAVVLFGCSYTFGEGLNDQETFAYKLGQALGDKYQVFNLGVGGYGTHHIYNIIQSKLPYLEKYDNIIVYYVALRTHRERVAGLSPWDFYGPRYFLIDGKLERAGSFIEQYPYTKPNLHEVLSKSFLYIHYYNHILKLVVPYNTDAKKNKIFNALTAASIEEFKLSYPNSIFNVLAWDKQTVDVLTELPKNVEITNVSAWFPEYDNNQALYEIPHDRHPNVLANSIVAEKLAKLVRVDEEKLKHMAK